MMISDHNYITEEYTVSYRNTSNRLPTDLATCEGAPPSFAVESVFSVFSCMHHNDENNNRTMVEMINLIASK